MDGVQLSEDLPIWKAERPDYSADPPLTAVALAGGWVAAKHGGWVRCRLDRDLSAPPRAPAKLCPPWSTPLSQSQRQPGQPSPANLHLARHVGATVELRRAGTHPACPVELRRAGTHPACPVELRRAGEASQQ